MELGLADKVAVVTAASRGLGYACAHALSGEGAKVAICSRDDGRIKAAACEISKLTDNNVLGIRADMMQRDDLIRFVDEAERTLGPVEVLVVSTGNPPIGKFSQIADGDWELGSGLCLRAPITLCRRVLHGMRQRRFGRIILLSSIFAEEPDESYVVSSTFRAGLRAFAKCLAREAGPDGVCTNVVCPGYFDTPLLRESAEAYATEAQIKTSEAIKSWAELGPAGRLGMPHELGSCVAWLASANAGYVNGATFLIDGGMMRS